MDDASWIKVSNTTPQAQKAVSCLQHAGNQGIWLGFLAGVAASSGNIEGAYLENLVNSISQVWQLSLEMNKPKIFEELTSQLMTFTCKTPLKLLETLTEKFFTEEEEEVMKEDNCNFMSQMKYQHSQESKLNNEAFAKIMQEDLIREEQEAERLKQEESQNLVKEIMEQEAESLAVSLQLRMDEEAKQNSEWQCDICLEPMGDKQYWPLECTHSYHRECLTGYFNSKISEKQIPLVCPNLKCKKEVQYSDLKEILDAKDFQKYEEFSLNNFIDNHSADVNQINFENDKEKRKKMSWCPSAGCKYAFVLEENQTLLICPLCRKQFCLSCRCEYHKGMTCKEYQISNTVSDADKKFNQFVRGQKFKQCLNCKMWVEKNQGCDHMTCRCGCQFCYHCGGPYGNCQCTKRRH